MPAPPLSRRWRAAALVGAIALVASCTSDPPAPDPASTSAEAPATAPGGATTTSSAPDADDVRAEGASLQPAGGPAVVLLVPTGGPDVTARPDGALDVTLAPPASGWLAAPEGLTLLVEPDGSLAVMEAEVVVAALGAPRTSGAAHRWVAGPADDLVELQAAASTASPAEVTVVVGGAAVVDATWGENEGGRSLAVDPADWARAGGIAAQAAVATQLAAAEPEAASATMRDQLACHALGAADKATWNLEPWRPEVDGLTMIATRCNPTSG